MPYICLARTDIPDGTLQVLDLVPNTSLRSDLDPPGQTRYLNRVQSDAVSYDPATGIAHRLNETAPIRGLSSYLLDRVEPGGLTAETQTIQILGGLAAGTLITIDGPAGAAVVFTAVLGAPNPAVQEYQDVAGSGSAIASAATLTAAINDAATQALLTTSIGATLTITAADGGTDTVTITADQRPGVAFLQTTLAEDSGATEVTLGGATMTRAVMAWTAALAAAASAGLTARLDAGGSLALADINTALSVVVAGTELTNAGGSTSTGAALDILEIMAGRGYNMPSGSQMLQSALLPLLVFEPTARGAFTEVNTVFDSQMLGGVITPLTPWVKHPGLGVTYGGDSVNVEIKGIRATVDGGSLAQSLLNGHLSKFQDGSVTLFPDSDMLPFQASLYQPGPNTAPVTPARIVTVYNDDGTLA